MSTCRIVIPSLATARLTRLASFCWVRTPSYAPQGSAEQKNRSASLRPPRPAGRRVIPTADVRAKSPGALHSACPLTAGQCNIPTYTYSSYALLARIMHALGQNGYKDEHKTMKER